jgi:hypothetical protein
MSCCSEFAQLKETYTNDQFVDPYWLDQKFLFNVPVKPSDSIRGYYVRVKIKSHSTVGTDVFLGQADIQFSSLVDEEELIGWFPLKPKTFSIRASPETLKVSGSIKLRVQWVHSIEGLRKHLSLALKRYEKKTYGITIVTVGKSDVNENYLSSGDFPLSGNSMLMYHY